MAASRDDVPPCLKAVGEEACELQVQVVPNASRTAVAGMHDGALRVRLMAPPIEGRANAALLAWLARSLGLPRRGVQLIVGDSSRRKRVRVECPTSQVAQWLRPLLADAGLDTDV